MSGQATSFGRTASVSTAGSGATWTTAAVANFWWRSPAPNTRRKARSTGLAHEHGLKDYLDSEWALRPLELVRERGQTMLVLEPTTARPLDEMIGPGPADRNVPATGHRRDATPSRVCISCGLVHKDIKASNILIDRQAVTHASLVSASPHDFRASASRSSRPS